MLSQIITEDCTNFPLFLDAETHEGYQCMQYLQQCILWVGQLDQDRFMPDDEIDQVREYIDIYLERVHKTAGVTKYIKCRDWVRFRMMTYMKLARELELYEQLSNLSKAFKLIYPK